METIGIIYRFYRNYRGIYWGYIGRMEKKMEAAI